MPSCFQAGTGLALLGLAGGAFLSVRPARAGDSIDFNRDIRPILSDKCFFCHGPDEHERKADLRLDTAEGARADLGGYAAIVPGAPAKSEFVARIVTDVGDDLMPPADSHKKLAPSEIDLLTRWIAEGAEYSDPWAYVAPAKHPLPEVGDADWPRNWIDRFLLGRLEKEGISPSPDADRVTLVRRLHFDLTGLPPAPERVRAFVDDERDFETAWTELVDELLASPHFGERLAVYWLDLVRYADTVGYHGDQDHSISPYRDYVIRSFNQNLPFDRFTREQLAGDLVPGSGKWQKIASGYNRLLQTSHEGGVQEKEYLAIYAADRVRNLSAVWMGATVGCAQCHDHKYDPFTLHDHYSLAAFFADVDEDSHLNPARRRGLNFNSLPSPRPPEMTVFTPEQEARKTRLDQAIAAILPAEARESLAKLETDSARLADQRKKAKTDEEKAKIDRTIADTKIAIEKAAPEKKRSEWKRLVAERVAIEKAGRPTMITVALDEPRVMRVLPRGNWLDDSGEIVAPAVPAFLGAIEPRDGDRADRLDLANWLTDPESGVGGLTARVFANRFWYLFFGSGISRSLEDFGGQGVPPEHPELLDNLAVAFVENGWDVKETVRLLVTSRAYRQASLPRPDVEDRDPYNQLVARQSRYRLPAEFLRDNALAVSGLLVDEIGGDSVRPYQPAGYYRHLNFPTRTYQSHKDERQWRRGLYVHWQRMFLHPMMKAMDAPSREECSAQRPRSNTPNAALVLLNDPTFLEAARVFASRVLGEESGNFEERLARAFLLAVSRLPDEEETRLLRNLHEQTRGEYQSDPGRADAFLSTGLTPAPKSIDPVELASWSAVTRALLNLNEANTRN